jgi:hypothetical protein
MKRLIGAALIMGAALGAQAQCPGGCCEITQGCYQPSVDYLISPGPEITGNYATQYIHNSRTDAYCADPMYYHALGQLQKWHRTRPYSGVSGAKDPWSMQVQRRPKVGIPKPVVVREK